MITKKVKKTSSSGIYMYAVSFLVFVIVVFGGVVYSITARTMKEQMGNKCLGLASAVAALLEENPKGYQEFIKTLDTGSDYYIRTKKVIEKIRFDNLHNIAFLYTEVRVSEGAMAYILDGEKEGTAGFSPPGSSDPLTVTRRRAYDTQSAYTGGFVTTGFGTLLSAYAPVFNPDTGAFIGLVGADVSKEQYDAIMKNQLAVIAGSAAVVALMGYFVIRMLSIARIRADKANAGKSEFLSNMSHEIRTPLNAVIGMTAIGKSASDIERKNLAFEKIESASAHLLGIINDILDMSKIEAGKFELSEHAFDFEKTIQDAVDIIRFRVAEKQQTLTVKTDPNIPRQLAGDSQRLAQTLVNLLANATKFTPEGGCVSLEARLLSEKHDVCSIEATVADTGIGISAEQLGRLFTPFQQAESGTSRKFGGTGLGLAISKRIVEMMGGGMSITSEPGEGTSVSFTARLKRTTLSCDNKAPSPSPGAHEFEGRHILLVDDMEINREIVMELLSPAGIEIDCAENGAQALQRYCEKPELYDLILMDIRMPEMDGYEATQRIRALDNQRAKSIPIVAMTANTFHDDVKRCLEAGMNGHLGKPLDVDALLAMLRKYLYKVEQPQQAAG